MVNKSGSITARLPSAERTGNGVSSMSWLVLIGCAGLLSLERMGYWWVWNHPDRFRNYCGQGASADASDPVDWMYRLFLLFKLIQMVVFFGWCMWFGQTWLPLPVAPLPVLLLGAIVLICGQVLNFSVFRTLGKTGVFYGNRFGHAVEWKRGFPFSLVSHPQYVGTLLSIWGFFAIMRYPEPDWIVLPLLETLYYPIGAHLESDGETEPAPCEKDRSSAQARD